MTSRNAFLGCQSQYCFQGWLAAKWDSLFKTLQFWKVWHGWLEAFLCRKVIKVILDNVGVWLCERQKLVFHGLLRNLLLTWPPNMSFADLAHIALGQALLHAVALQKAVPTMLCYWFKHIQTKKPLQANGFQMIALEAKTEKQQAEPRAALQVSGHLLSCWKICLDKYVKRKPKRFCFPPLPVWFTIAVFAWLFTTRQPTIFCLTKEIFTLPFVPLLPFLLPVVVFLSWTETESPQSRETGTCHSHSHCHGISHIHRFLWGKLVWHALLPQHSSSQWPFAWALLWLGFS